MPIPAVCPSCGRKLRAPDSWAGRKTKCPKCGSGIGVPTPRAITGYGQRTEAKDFNTRDELMARWYYSTGGKRQGPVSDAELQALAEEGKLRPSNHVWKKGMLNWAPASTVTGLFSEDLPPPLPPSEPPPVLLKRAFGKLRAWVRYAAIPSGCLAIILVAVLITTLSGDSPRQRLLGTWKASQDGHESIWVFSSDGTMAIPSIDAMTNREEMSFLRRLRYKVNGADELVLIHTEASAIRFNQSFVNSPKAQAGDEAGRARIAFPSKDEMIVTHIDGRKRVYQRAR
jgi:hypothetical protein